MPEQRREARVHGEDGIEKLYGRLGVAHRECVGRIHRKRRHLRRVLEERVDLGRTAPGDQGLARGGLSCAAARAALNGRQLVRRHARGGALRELRLHLVITEVLPDGNHRVVRPVDEHLFDCRLKCGVGLPQVNIRREFLRFQPAHDRRLGWRGFSARCHGQCSA